MSKSDTRRIVYLMFLCSIFWGYYVATGYRTALVLAILVSLALGGNWLRASVNRKRIQYNAVRRDFRRIAMIFLVFDDKVFLKRNHLWRGLMPPFADVPPHGSDREVIGDLLRKVLPENYPYTNRVTEFLFEFDWMGLSVSCFQTNVPFKLVQFLETSGYQSSSLLPSTSASEEKAHLAQKALTLYQQRFRAPTTSILATPREKQIPMFEKSPGMTIQLSLNLPQQFQSERFWRRMVRTATNAPWQNYPRSFSEHQKPSST